MVNGVETFTFTPFHFNQRQIIYTRMFRIPEYKGIYFVINETNCILEKMYIEPLNFIISNYILLIFLFLYKSEVPLCEARKLFKVLDVSI